MAALGALRVTLALAICSPSAAVRPAVGATALGSTQTRQLCRYDAAGMLKLREQEFDQSAQGWRRLEAAGCEAAAADLIRRYRIAHRSNSTTLYWHEGQLRASLGQHPAAISLMRKAKHRNEMIETGWNHYVDATVAFLRRDRAALLKAREALANTRWPAGVFYQDEAGGKRLGPPPGWPANLDVVDGLVTCFKKPYREAYANGCRRGMPEER